MISIRPICRSDYATWRSMLDDYDDELGVKDIECAWERFFTAPNKFVGKVAEFDGETAGFIHYTFHEFVLMRGRICYLANLYVKPEFRRRGIAREMLEQLIAQAQNESWRRVYWVTEHSNPARALYDQYAISEFVRYHRDFWGESVSPSELNSAPTLDRNAIIEECAMVCEKEADDYQERESLKYAECRSDAEQGCRTCQYAILELKDAPQDGAMEEFGTPND